MRSAGLTAAATVVALVALVAACVGGAHASSCSAFTSCTTCMGSGSNGTCGWCPNTATCLAASSSAGSGSGPAVVDACNSGAWIGPPTPGTSAAAACANVASCGVGGNDACARCVQSPYCDWCFDSAGGCYVSTSSAVSACSVWAGTTYECTNPQSNTNPTGDSGGGGTSWNYYVWPLLFVAFLGAYYAYRYYHTYRQKQAADEQSASRVPTFVPGRTLHTAAATTTATATATARAAGTGADGDAAFGYQRLTDADAQQQQHQHQQRQQYQQPPQHAQAPVNPYAVRAPSARADISDEQYQRAMGLAPPQPQPQPQPGYGAPQPQWGQPIQYHAPAPGPQQPRQPQPQVSAYNPYAAAQAQLASQAVYADPTPLQQPQQPKQPQQQPQPQGMAVASGYLMPSQQPFAQQPFAPAAGYQQQPQQRL